MVRPLTPKPSKLRVGRPRKHLPVGRPSLITPEVVKAICEAIASGETVRDAAGCIGLHKDTLKNWITKGNELRRKGEPWTPEEKLYVILAEGVQNAISIKASYCVDQILDAARVDWKAAAWILVNDPDTREDWHPHDERTITHKGRVDHDHTHKVLTKEMMAGMSLESKMEILNAMRGIKTEPKKITEVSPTEAPIPITPISAESTPTS